MKGIKLNLEFSDEDYAELEEMAEYLDCSVADVLVKCLVEGLIERNWFDDEVCEKQKIRFARLRLNELVS